MFMLQNNVTDLILGMAACLVLGFITISVKGICVIGA